MGAHARNLLSRREMTLVEWGDMPEDDPGELVDGRLVEEEMPSAIHEMVVIWLTYVLQRWLGERGFVLGSGAKFAVGPRRGRIPDLSVYLPRGRVPELRGVVTVPPDIAVEVVSPTPRDMRRDRIEKMDDYATFAVRWYWLLDPELRTLEIYELAGKASYRRVLHAEERVVRSIPGCRGLVLDLRKLWKRIDRAMRAATRGERAPRKRR